MSLYPLCSIYTCGGCCLDDSVHFESEASKKWHGIRTFVIDTVVTNFEKNVIDSKVTSVSTLTNYEILPNQIQSLTLIGKHSRGIIEGEQGSFQFNKFINSYSVCSSKCMTYGLARYRHFGSQCGVQ